MENVIRAIKIIKLNKNGEQNTVPAALEPPKVTAKNLRSEMTSVITGWINDWRGQEKSAARSSFNHLFQTSE